MLVSTGSKKPLKGSEKKSTKGAPQTTHTEDILNSILPPRVSTPIIIERNTPWRNSSSGSSVYQPLPLPKLMCSRCKRNSTSGYNRGRHEKLVSVRYGRSYTLSASMSSFAKSPLTVPSVDCCLCGYETRCEWSSNPTRPSTRARLRSECGNTCRKSRKRLASVHYA